LPKQLLFDSFIKPLDFLKGRIKMRALKFAIMSLILIFSCGFCLAAETEYPALTAQLTRDYRTLQALIKALDKLYSEMDSLCERLGNTPCLTLNDEERLFRWHFAFLNVRKALAKIAKQWQPEIANPAISFEQKGKILNVSFAALIEWYRAACYMALKPAKVKIISKKLNELIPEFGIPAGEMTRTIGDLGDSNFREKIDQGFHDIWAGAEMQGMTTHPFFAG